MEDVPLGFLDGPLTGHRAAATGSRASSLGGAWSERSGLTTALAHLLDPAADHGLGTAFVDALLRVSGAGAPVGRASAALGHRGWVVSELRDDPAASHRPQVKLLVDAPDLDLAVVVAVDPTGQLDVSLPPDEAASDARPNMGGTSDATTSPLSQDGAIDTTTSTAAPDGASDATTSAAAQDGASAATPVGSPAPPPVVETCPERTRILRVALVRAIDEASSIAALAESFASSSGSPASDAATPASIVATFDELFDAASDAVYDAGPVADPAALRSIEHLIEVTSERMALARAARERRALDELWAAIEPHQDQVLDFLAATSDAARMLRERAERVAELATQLLRSERRDASPTGAPQQGAVVEDATRALVASAKEAPRDAPVQARVAVLLHDGGAVELRCGWLPHLGTFGQAVVALRDADRPETVAPDWGFVPLHLAPDAGDAVVAERFVDLVRRRVAGRRPA